jgi:hypothetical protein
MAPQETNILFGSKMSGTIVTQLRSLASQQIGISRETPAQLAVEC